MKRESVKALKRGPWLAAWSEIPRVEPHRMCPLDQPLPLKPCLSSLHPHQPAGGSSCESTDPTHMHALLPTTANEAIDKLTVHTVPTMYQRSNDAERRIPATSPAALLCRHARPRSLRASSVLFWPCPMPERARHGVPLAIPIVDRVQSWLAPHIPSPSSPTARRVLDLGPGGSLKQGSKISKTSLYGPVGSQTKNPALLDRQPHRDLLSLNHLTIHSFPCTDSTRHLTLGVSLSQHHQNVFSIYLHCGMSWSGRHLPPQLIPPR